MALGSLLHDYDYGQDGFGHFRLSWPVLMNFMYWFTLDIGLKCWIYRDLIPISIPRDLYTRPTYWPCQEGTIYMKHSIYLTAPVMAPDRSWNNECGQSSTFQGCGSAGQTCYCDFNRREAVRPALAWFIEVIKTLALPLAVSHLFSSCCLLPVDLHQCTDQFYCLPWRQACPTPILSLFQSYSCSKILTLLYCPGNTLATCIASLDRTQSRSTQPSHPSSRKAAQQPSIRMTFQHTVSSWIPRSITYSTVF